MSRVRTELSVVQFQVQARDANAALESMQNRASELRGEIDSVQQKIKAIGDVEVETPELIGYKNQLSQLERKLKDVINAQRELTKGVRAADKVWKAAQTGTMEQLTIKELKAGERGVRARMQNLSPGNADDAKAYRAYGAVLEETRIAIRGFEGEVQHVLQTIHDGGNVSTDMLKRAKDGLSDLKDVTAQGTKEWNDYRLQLEELGRYEQQQIDTERRLRGEMANVNDAREAAKKLTKEGAEAARQASQAYEEEIKAGREKIAGLAEQRDAKEAEARATNETIVETDKLIAKKRDEIDATEKAIKADKKQADSAHQKAEQTRNIAEQLKTSAEQQEKAFEKEKASVEKLENEIGGLQGKLQALGTQSVKPQVNTSEIEKLEAEIKKLIRTRDILKERLSDGNESLEEELEILKKIGLTEDELNDKNKVEQKVEEKTLEILRLEKDMTQEIESATAQELQASSGDINIPKNARKSYEEAIGAYDNLDYEQTIERITELHTHRAEKEDAFGEPWSRELASELRYYQQHLQKHIHEMLKKGIDVSEDDLESMDYGDEGWGHNLAEKMAEIHRSIDKSIDGIMKSYEDKIKETGVDLWPEDYDGDTEKIKKDIRNQIESVGESIKQYRGYDTEDAKELADVEKKIEKQKELIDVSRQQTQATTGSVEANKQNIKQTEDDIASLTETIKELEKQREKLTAVQTAGAEAAKKDGEAIKMSAAEADAALKKRAEKSTVTLRGDHGLELSNPMEFEARVKKQILSAAGEKGKNNEGGYQTYNKEQLNKVLAGIADAYGFTSPDGKRDLGFSREVLSRFVRGKSGGAVTGGAFDKEQGILRLDIDPEKQKAYVNETKELLAIKNGVTQATNEQSAANERNAQSEKELAEAEQKRAVLTQQITVLETQRQQKQEQLSQLQQQAAQDTGEQERLTEELANKTAELTKKKEELSAQEKQLNFAKEEAVKKDKEATELESKLNQNSDERTENLKEQQNEEQALIAQREEQVKKLEEQNQQTAQLNQQIGAEATKVQEAEQKKAQAQELTADKMREAIALLEKRNKALNDSEPEWVENERLIAQYNQRLDEMKRKSDELRREPVTEMMQQRIQNIGNLSNDAVAETRKFWQAMYDGAERNDPKLKEIEQNLKAINAEEQKRNAGALKESAGKLLGDITTLSEGELRKSIEAAREYQKTLVVGEEEHRKYSEAIVVAENRISKFGVEAERASQRQAESIQLMQDQLGKGDALTESALKTQERFWQHLIDDPKSAAESLDTYKESLKKVKELQDQMATTSNEQKARIVQSGTLDNYSEAEIRESINAAKELHAHMQSASPEAQKLAEAIANAEVHVKKYGVESARAARQQAESNKLMQDQLNNIFYEKLYGIAMPTASQLKAQKQYWQHLIDDPKTAASSLQQYRDRLAEVEQLEREMIDINGKTALTWFQDGNDKNASGNQVKEMADKLKEYRGTLLQETNAAEIQQIDDILQRIGVSAKKAGEGLMDFEEAKKLALQAGEDVYGKKNPSFLASPEQIQAATKSIEKYREELFKTIKQKHDMGEATDAEEAELQELAKYLKNLKFEQDNFNMSREKMEGLMKTPVNATSIDELRAAIKRADAELKRMDGSLGDNNDKYKEFAKQVKNAKAVLKGMEDQAKATNNVWAQAWSRLKTYVGMYMGFNAVWQRITGTMGDLMELSDKMGEVRKTTGFTADEVGRLSMNLKKLDVRTSLTDLMNISASAGQLGLKTIEDVQGFTEAANKMMIALPEMGQEAATEIMRVAIATGEVDKIRKQLDGTVEGSNATAVAMEKIASTVDRLRASSASTAPEITDFIKRVGAIGAQSGISIDQIAALGSTISSLGMRVEMSATALSRMIPAIRNNAFDLAQVLGVTPDSIRQLFDAGRGMEVIMMILQHIKDNNMDEDSIEALLGMGGMQEIMKELNQQGARAGIVFAGLSQNVDELRKHLGIAKTAYEENIAIQEEFDKMNETTAAKWERLKNQVEEAFVSDSMQSTLGVIIDYLRDLVDILTGNVSGALRSVNVLLYTFATYWGVLKLGLGGALLGLKNMGSALGNLIKNTKQAIIYSKLLSRAQNEQAATAVRARAAQNGLNKAMVANIWVAVTAAVIAATIAIYNWATSVKTGKKVQAEANAEIDKARDRFEGYFNAIKQTSNTLQTVNAQHSKLSAEVEKLRKSTDGSAEATEKLKKKEEELKKSTLDLVKAKEDHRTAIAEMNGIYGKYLGFLLTEENYANMAAAAHNKVAAAIEREILVKKQLDALNNVDQETQEERTKGSASLAKDLSSIGGLKNNQITRARQDLKDFLKNNFSYDAKKERIIPSANIWQQLSRQGIEKHTGYQPPEDLAALWFNSYLERTFHLNSNQRERITGMTLGPTIDGKRKYSIYRTGFADNLRADYLTAYFDDIRKKGDATDDINDDIKDRDKKINAAAAELANKLVADANASIAKIKKGVEVEGAYSILANSILGLEEQIKSLDSKKDAALINKISQVIATTNQQVDARKLTQAKDKLHASLFEQATWQSEDTTNTNTSSSSKIWGGDEEAASTDWKKMTGKQLVARREQMNKFVNALQNDTDVKAVLAEDAALMKAFKGRQADMRSVIEWYNTERLKIQEELHARHLTNTGDWMDPKKQRQVKNQIKDDMKYYLDELDAYYTERKAKIQDAQNDGEISEAEAQNRTLANEAEWRMRRAELQQLYADKAEKVTSDEQQAIFNIISERTGDTADFVQKDINQTVKFIRAIGEKSRVAMEKIQGSLDKEIEKDFLRRSQAIGKHLDAIQAIIDKERPFNGITKDLQDNLTTMGILTAHLNKERDELMAKNADTTEFNHKQSEEMFKELAFLLRESETAFSTTAEELMQRAAKAGLQAWVDEMKNNPQMQEGLMAQLRSTYDAVQDAIKKEATLIKRHLETQWSDILPGADMSRKDTFEKAISDLGLMGDQVNRANSLISAGPASQRMADKLAIKQLEIQLQMQQVYYALMQKIGSERVRQLNASAQASKREAEALKKKSEELKKQGKLSEAELAALQAQDAERRALNASFDAEYAQKSLNLAKTKELAEEEKQRKAIQNQLEESQNRLYTQLREWAGLLSSSLQSLFEASHAGDAEYYNELAKLNLTGSGGPGAGTYVVIENEGTSDATAHYEYLDQRQALERQREIEQQNAVADAWKKVMDDINMKMSDMITDQLNVMLQNPSIDANTQAVIKNTEAIYASMGMQGGGSTDYNGSSESRHNSESSATNSSGQEDSPILTGLTADKTQEVVTNIQTIHQADADAAINAAQQVSDATAELPNKAPDLTGLTEERTSAILDNAVTLWDGYSDISINAMQQVSDAMEEIPNKMPNISDMTEEQVDAQLELLYQQNQGVIDINDKTYQSLMAMKQKNQQNTVQNDKKEEQSTSSKFAKMAAAANMYGIAYQTMSNDNLSTAQKFQVFALQAAGQAAISMLTMDLAKGKADNLVQMPGILGKLLGEMPYPAAMATFAGITALMGGLMALAMSSVTKSKSQIAQVSGASVGAGRLSTGMLTYAEGNVNEFTDPASLTPGRQYNVDATDGRTYRARYMGNNPKTHLTNGPEFHLSGEKGREMIIDAGTTRQITMNETGIWHAIQTLSGGGRIAATRRRGGGVRAFADGNVSEFEDMSNTGDTGSMGIATEQTVALQASIDRQSDLLERALTEGIKGVFNVYGKDGLVDSYDRGKKTLNRHGEKY